MRNDVPRVAQRYGTIAAHTRGHASVLVVFVVFCVHMYSFAGSIRRTPPPTFSDTAITDRDYDTTTFQLRAHWVRQCCFPRKKFSSPEIIPRDTFLYSTGYYYDWQTQKFACSHPNYISSPYT